MHYEILPLPITFSLLWSLPGFDGSDFVSVLNTRARLMALSAVKSRGVKPALLRAIKTALPVNDKQVDLETKYVSVYENALIVPQPIFK